MRTTKRYGVLPVHQRLTLNVYCTATRLGCIGSYLGQAGPAKNATTSAVKASKAQMTLRCAGRDRRWYKGNARGMKIMAVEDDMMATMNSAGASCHPSAYVLLYHEWDKAYLAHSTGERDEDIVDLHGQCSGARTRAEWSADSPM